MREKEMGNRQRWMGRGNQDVAYEGKRFGSGIDRDETEELGFRSSIFAFLAPSFSSAGIQHRVWMTGNQPGYDDLLPGPTGH